jgi:hypothetical protein
MTTAAQTVLDRIRARAKGDVSQVIEDRLAEWRRADRITGSPEWSEQDQTEAREWLRAHEEPPIVVELAKFGTVSELLRRYDMLVDRLTGLGKLSAAEAETSKMMIRNASVAGVIREGKSLKQWIDQLEKGPA